MAIEGQDRSEFNAPYTPAALSSLQFAYARATRNQGIVDGKWAVNKAVLKAWGGLKGAYHWGVGNADPVQQANAFLAQVDGGKGWLLFLDFEPLSGVPAMSPVEGKAFIASIHGRGLKVGLYSSNDTWPGNLGQDYSIVAAYPGPPTIHYDIHQYAARAGVADLDRSPLTTDQLAAFSNGANQQGDFLMALSDTDQQMIRDFCQSFVWQVESAFGQKGDAHPINDAMGRYMAAVKTQTSAGALAGSAAVSINLVPKT